MLAINTHRELGELHLYFDLKGKEMLLCKLGHVKEEQDHEFMVLGGDLDEYHPAEQGLKSCDFVNIIYSQDSQEDCSITDSPNGFASLELCLSESSLDSLINISSRMEPSYSFETYSIRLDAANTVLIKLFYGEA